MDKNTYGAGKAAETLAYIIDTKYPKLSRKVSVHHHRFNQGLRNLHYGLTKQNNPSFLISIFNIYQNNAVKNVKSLKLPTDVESYLLNIMSKSYKIYINHEVAKSRRIQSDAAKQRHADKISKSQKDKTV